MSVSNSNFLQLFLNLCLGKAGDNDYFLKMWNKQEKEKKKAVTFTIVLYGYFFIVLFFGGLTGLGGDILSEILVKLVKV